MSWSDVNYAEKFTRKKLGRILGPVEDALTAENEHRQSFRDTDHLHPSSLSKNDWCPREAYYKITKETETNQSAPSLRRLNIFAEGNSIHEKWQRWMWRAGGLYGRWECRNCDHDWWDTSPEVCPSCFAADRVRYMEVPIENKEHHILGHADGVWEDDQGRAVVEIKTVGLGTIRWDAPSLYEGYANGDLDLDGLWAAIKRPLLPHRKQANLYMYCLGLEDAIVIYEWKPSQEVKEFHLTLNTNLVQTMLDGADLVIKHLELGAPPDRPEGFYKTKQCKFCPFKDKCWEKK